MTETLFPTRTFGEEISDTRNEFEGIIEVPEALAAAAAVTNYSVRDMPPYAVTPPKGLFLIYFTTEDDGTPLAFHYYDASIDDLDKAEGVLYEEAKNGGPYVGKDFENLAWKAPTHISIVLDVDDHEFYWRNPKGYDPVVFLLQKERDETPTTARPFAYQPNASFFDASLSTLVDPVSGKTRPVLRFKNYHRKNAAGDPFGQGEKASYCMNIQLLAKYKGGKVWKHIIDPDSENQGPGG